MKTLKFRFTYNGIVLCSIDATDTKNTVVQAVINCPEVCDPAQIMLKLRFVTFFPPQDAVDYTELMAAKRGQIIRKQPTQGRDCNARKERFMYYSEDLQKNASIFSVCGDECGTVLRAEEKCPECACEENNNV